MKKRVMCAAMLCSWYVYAAQGTNDVQFFPAHPGARGELRVMTTDLDNGPAIVQSSVGNERAQQDIDDFRKIICTADCLDQAARLRVIFNPGLLAHIIEEESGNTALHVALQRNNVGLFKSLVDSKARLSVKNKNEQTPLVLASVVGNDEIVKICLQYRADAQRFCRYSELAINSSDTGAMGRKPLSPELLARLKERSEGQCEADALRLAFLNGHVDVIELFSIFGLKVRDVLSTEDFVQCCKELSQLRELRESIRECEESEEQERKKSDLEVSQIVMSGSVDELVAV